jgi:alkylation response protein AidB-like acyl-CoA dehydrogenase
METPGIEVRPLATMTGQSEFNEVFFTDVRVPKEQIIGARGQGWEAANATLKHERDSVGNPNSGGANAAMRLNQIAAILQQERIDGRPQIDNALLRDRLVQLRSRAEALRCHGLRMLAASARRERKGAAGLIVKLVGCELNHQIAALAIDALGEGGTLADLSWQRRYMYALGLIIGGGTAQIQKNIISERGLGMPREPKSKEA